MISGIIYQEHLIFVWCGLLRKQRLSLYGEVCIELHGKYKSTLTQLLPLEINEIVHLQSYLVASTGSYGLVHHILLSIHIRRKWHGGGVLEALHTPSPWKFGRCFESNGTETWICSIFSLFFILITKSCTPNNLCCPDSGHFPWLALNWPAALLSLLVLWRNFILFECHWK